MYFKYYSRKSQREETIHLSWQTNGWLIQHPLHSGLADTRGEPYIEQCFQACNSVYLEALGDAFAELWEGVQKEVLSKHQIQERLNAFSHWIKSANI